VIETLVVVDASLAAMWALPEAGSPKALALAEHWENEAAQMLAPCLLLAEVTNALYKRILRGEMDVPMAQTALDVILAFDIEMREEPGLAARALVLAQELQRPTTYDCHYLALAEALDCPLWTGDERFYNAVHRAHPRVNWVGTSA
jgi:predicted nucleic acid-binding protein